MDSSVSLIDQIWFLRVCHHISTGLYNYCLIQKVQLLPSLKIGHPEYGLSCLYSVSSGTFHDNGWNQSKTESLPVLTCSLTNVKLAATPQFWSQYQGITHPLQFSVPRQATAGSSDPARPSSYSHDLRLEDALYYYPSIYAQLSRTVASFWFCKQNFIRLIYTLLSN